MDRRPFTETRLEPGRDDSGFSIQLKNEFAVVRVSLDNSGNGPRLRISDEQSGSEILLDPLELSVFSTCVHADFAQFMEALRIPGGRVEVESFDGAIEDDRSGEK
jgi:hypothetical protein